MQDITVTSSLLVSSATFNLQLSVASQTLLSSYSLPSAFLSSAASEREIWISRGQGFCLSFRLLFDGERVRANDPQYGGLVERFARALRDAELWTQLHLRAYLSLPSHDQHGLYSLQRDIIIHLYHLRNDVDASGSSHTLEDVKPPLGVPLAAINEVHLTLAFSTSTCDSSSWHRAPKRSNITTGIPNNTKGPRSELLKSENGDFEWLCFSQPSVSASYEEDQTLHPNLGEISSSISLQLDSISPRLQLFQAPPDPPSRAPKKRTAEASQNVVRSLLLSVCPELEHMILLADVALRNLVVDRPLWTPPGVVSVGAAPSFRLSEVAPSLWSPGYLPAISKRYRFLTVISRAISFPIYTNTRSPALKKKLEQLSSIPPSPLMYSPPTSTPEESQHPLQDPCTSTGIYNVVQARLWRMMQQSLYNPSAARRLKPVKSFGAHQNASLRGYPDEILQEGEQDDMALEHEILLEDQMIDNLSPGPSTLEECSDDKIPIDLPDYQGSSPFGQDNHPAPPRQRVSNFKEWYHPSAVRKESGHFLDLDEDLFEMPTEGSYDEVRSVIDECHNLRCQTNLLGTPASELVAGDSFRGFPEDHQTASAEDELHPIINRMHEPFCKADLLDIPRCNALMSGSFQEFQPDQLALVEDDLLFSKENLVYQQEQSGYADGEMLF